MNGNDMNSTRSRYDYYYSISSPSLSQATSYYENQSSLFGEPIAPLLPTPIQKRSPSPQQIQTPLTPFDKSSTLGFHTNYTTDVHSSLIENFDNHLYESIRKNILDKNSDNQTVTNDLLKHHVWTQNSVSSSSSEEVQSNKYARASTSLDLYKNNNNDSFDKKYRSSSSRQGKSDMRCVQRNSNKFLHHNNDSKLSTKLQNENSSTSVLNRASLSKSSSSSLSKLNNAVPHVILDSKRKKTLSLKRSIPFTMVKSKSDLISLKSYPESFTIVTSPRLQSSNNCGQSKRSKTSDIYDDDDDDEEQSIMKSEWITPSNLKLYEAASTKDVNENENPLYINDIVQGISNPTTPILTDKIMTGSHRVPSGSFRSHKRIAFAIINDYKNRRTRMLKQRHSDDDMDLDGRLSPYTKYLLQRELSAPALNRLESFESSDGEFFYYLENESLNEEDGKRKTSIGFVHKNNRLSSSMSNINKKTSQNELQKHGQQYMSTPNFIKINKRIAVHSTPLERLNPKLVMHRSLKGVLKVFNNTNIQKRTFSLDNIDNLFLPNGKIDPNLLAPMPIKNEEKRSEKLSKQQIKAQKKRTLVLRRRKLSPIMGTPNKESEGKKLFNKSEDTPKKKISTPKSRLEERLKKDKFGRLITPKKAPLPNFSRSNTKSKMKKNEIKLSFEKQHEDDEQDRKAISFMQQLQAKNILGKSLKARREAKQPPPLTRQSSKQSIESIYQDKPPLKKKSSFSSLKSISASVKTVASIKTNQSNSVDDEEAEAGDEITKLKNVKKDAKSKIKGSMKILSLGRVTSSSSSKSQKESAPPPSRTGSKTSIVSHSSTKVVPTEAAHDTPSRKSDILRVPSATSIMSMTTAAITANPLNTTLTITNQLATQGAEILEKKQIAAAAAAATVEKIDEPSTSNLEQDQVSMSSQKTVSSQKTGSRKASAKASSRKDSAKSSSGKQRSRQGSLLSAIVSAHHAVKQLTRRKSNDSIKSEKSDATQITIGPGQGVDNKDSSVAPIGAGKILQDSQRSLEKVQKTVDKATHEIHQTINEKILDLKTLEKKLSKSNLLEHDTIDANNNDVEKTRKGMSRNSTKLDMQVGTSTSNITQINSRISEQSKANKSSTTNMEKDKISDNAISVTSKARTLPHEESEILNESNSSTSSSLNEISRKRKNCCGLSTCCTKKRSESAQMIAGNTKRKSIPNRISENCFCLPFKRSCNLCRKQKNQTSETENVKQSCCSKWWICRSKKKGETQLSKKQEKIVMESKGVKKDENERGCLRFCKLCCLFNCCSKKKDSMESNETKPNGTPSSCTRFFCFCCLCCRKKTGSSENEIRTSMSGQQSEVSKGNRCGRMCTTLFCCCCKKQTKQDSRRASMLSKKQSLAPTIPPPEEKKPKLDMVLVEHASLMKGAIPVLPICLAYFCLICNIIIPGSGTILSGLFCVCIGIPRFSQHDGARGRIGSFIINCIVGISQAFTIIFCLVGWGWSIWWGTIMIHLSKRHRKIKKAERLRQEDEERQLETDGKNVITTAGGAGISRGKSRDVERGIN